jgi:hypothetical protein
MSCKARIPCVVEPGKNTIIATVSYVYSTDYLKQMPAVSTVT